MVICKKCGTEFQETSENDVKEAFKENDKWIQKMALKSIKKNLCPECSTKKTKKIFTISFGLLFCCGVFTIVAYIIIMDFVYLMWGVTLMPLSIVAYYFYVKKDVLKLFSKNDSSNKRSK